MRSSQIIYNNLFGKALSYVRVHVSRLKRRNLFQMLERNLLGKLIGECNIEI
jgi:hypothetical protein